MAASNDNSFDPRRRLCPDGACIGVVGSDGRCSVCGASDPGGGADDASSRLGSQEDAAADAFDHEVADQDSPLGDDPAPSAFDPNRRLCADDSCIGVIGKDNRCSVCGRASDA
jgi:hypothetical protein